MNLDIMSLMAASAAVAPSTPGIEGEAAVAADGSPKDSEGSSFSSILQSLTDPLSDSLEPEDVLDAQALLSATGQLADTDVEATLRGQGMPSTGLAVAVPGQNTGEALPPTGNELPLDLLVDDPAGESLAAMATIPSTVPAAIAAVTAGAAQVAGPAQTDRAALAPVLTGRSGWFSNAASLNNAAPTPQPVATADPLASANAPAPEAMPVTGDMLAALRGQTPGKAKSETPNPASLIGVLATASDATQLTEPPRSIGGIATTVPTNGQTMTNQLATVGPATTLNLAAGGWDKALGQRLVFMAANGIDGAELRLDPPALGTVHVKLSLQGDHAQLLMQAANPAAREALETALPRLREMFDANGLQLDSAQVADREASNRQPNEEQGGAWLNANDDGQGEIDEVATSVESLTLGSGRIYERV